MSYESDSKKARLCIVGEDASEEFDTIFPVPPEGFGFSVKKLHKAMQDRLRALGAEALRLLAEKEVGGDGQRRCLFEAGSNNKFANAFPLIKEAKAILKNACVLGNRRHPEHFCHGTHHD